MERAKLTVRLPRDLLEEAKRYAQEHNTTLTRLVSEYLRRLSVQDDPLVDAPIVRRLSGILSQEASIEDYYKYLEEKYGGQT
jgi:replication fork clamp-binding protein CrfC